ncbi:MAG: hypothetical protein PHF20_03610 [Halothiobacillaceae bacterium]|nr:hypothetical protein [Halothiobacillaceae bacterium]
MSIPWRWLWVALILLGSWKYLDNRPVKVSSGVLVKDNPVQKDLPTGVVYPQGKYSLVALAEFEIEARVLSKEIYHFDRGAELVPVDLALGWGAMSDSAVLEQLSITQGGRFYRYRWKGEPPIPPADIVRHSANMHLIPTSPAMVEQIKKVRPGQIVHITGQLVEARDPDGGYWRSSLTREDSGNGACELIRVVEFESR